MPSVQDMIEMAELLKVQAIAIDEDKCARVRNRNSSCDKCEKACIRDAIQTARNEVRIDQAQCVNCGCCIAVCPTSALSAIEPNIAQVAADVAKKQNREFSQIVFACGRKAARHEADAESYVELPCLGHIQEALLLKCASVGIEDIVLVDGNCGTCKYGEASSRIDDTCVCAIDMIESVGGGSIITRTSDFPQEILSDEREKERNIRGKDRRGIIAQTGGYVGHVAMNVAKKTVNDKLGSTKTPRTLHERLSAGKSGRMPTFAPETNFELLDDLQEVCEANGGSVDEYFDESLDGRHFGSIEIDIEKCSGCGLCVMFCPTAALKHAQYDEPEDESRKYLEFDASLCCQCMLCKDVCIRGCLDVIPSVKIGDLFDLDPQLIEISKPKERTGILDFKKRW